MPSPTPGGNKPKMPRQPRMPKKQKKPGFVVDPAPGDRGTPIPTLPVRRDDKIIRTMPITEKQLGQIKKYYGIK